MKVPNHAIPTGQLDPQNLETRQLRLSAELHDEIVDLAYRDGVTYDQWISWALILALTSILAESMRESTIKRWNEANWPRRPILKADRRPT